MEEDDAHEIKRDLQYTGVSLESLRDLYLAERARRETVRGQLAVPVSIISFSIFGYVSFAEYFHVLEAGWVTMFINVLMVFSLTFLFFAMIYLARVEMVFMRVEVGDVEDMRDADSEFDYFRGVYSRMSQQNVAAARERGRSFILLLLALGCFVAAVVLLPFHLRDAGVHNGDNREAARQAATTAPAEWARARPEDYSDSAASCASASSAAHGLSSATPGSMKGITAPTTGSAMPSPSAAAPLAIRFPVSGVISGSESGPVM